MLLGVIVRASQMNTVLISARCHRLLSCCDQLHRTSLGFQRPLRPLPWHDLTRKASTPGFFAHDNALEIVCLFPPCLSEEHCPVKWKEQILVLKASAILTTDNGTGSCWASGTSSTVSLQKLRLFHVQGCISQHFCYRNNSLL